MPIADTPPRGDELSVDYIAGASLASRYVGIEPGDVIELAAGRGMDGQLLTRGGKYRVTKVLHRPYLKLYLERLTSESTGFPTRNEEAT